MMDKTRASFLRISRLPYGLSLLAILAGLGLSRGMAATFIVSNTNASGAGSLQQAILSANATSGLDTIVFQIPGSGVHTISPANALPTITDPVVIDGTSQPGYGGTPLIELNGANAGTSSDGLNVTAGGSTIRGLIINRFYGAGLSIQAPGSSNVIQGNYIGTDRTGTISQGNGRATTRMGGVLVQGSSGNVIGGTNSAHRNVISANGGTGIYLHNCSGNTIQGNRVGTCVSGMTALGNTTNGIGLYNAGGNLIGGTSTAARNVVSGNNQSGIYLYGAGSTGNRIQGNYIGTDASGHAGLGNGATGVLLNGSSDNTIGGTQAGAGNVICRSGFFGVEITGGCSNNLVQGNFIGTDASGGAALGNCGSGVCLSQANSNLIGGTVPTARNLISGNALIGILITNGVGNVVAGNLVGTDVTGAQRLGNLMAGIRIFGANSNLIGGTLAGARNLISGNAHSGLEIMAGATGNLVQGNYIGTDLAGYLAVSNGVDGIHIESPRNTIGGTVNGAGNLISGNRTNGIFLTGNQAAGNLIQGNFIGTTADGKAGLMNYWAGIGISHAPGNLIGGTTPGAGNLVSANAIAAGDAGIFLIGSGANGNVIQGNKLGTDITGTLSLGNRHEGVYLESAPSNTIGGITAAAANLISGNQTRGLFLDNSSWNVIQGNLIGTKADGISALGNLFHSVECEAGANNNMIGGAGGAANTIAYAQDIYAGVRIRNVSYNNAILGNRIFGNGALGIDLGNPGVNAIIPCGSTSGGNLSQNYPTLAQAVSGAGTAIRGMLNCKPNQPYVLQFFANPACDPFGYGEGQFYLGQITVVTGANCTNSFVAHLPTPVPPGYSTITATATDSANNTSEFSACIPVGPVPTLEIEALANPQVRISWTNTAAGFVLKETTSLSPPIQWQTVSNTPILSNGQLVVTLPLNPSNPALRQGNRFFLLSFE